MHAHKQIAHYKNGNIQCSTCAHKHTGIIAQATCTHTCTHTHAHTHCRCSWVRWMSVHWPLPRQRQRHGRQRSKKRGRPCSLRCLVAHLNNSTRCLSGEISDQWQQEGLLSCIYMHTNSHMYTHTLARTHIHMHTHLHVHRYTCIHTHNCTYTYTHMHTHTLARTHIHICTHTHMHTCT